MNTGEDRDQLAAELLSAQDNLSQVKRCLSEAESHRLDEVTDLRSQLEMQKGLESAIAQDLEEVNEVVRAQADDLLVSWPIPLGFLLQICAKTAT